MGHVRVRPNVTAEALQVTSPEEEAILRTWMDVPKEYEATLQDMITQKVWFIRTSEGVALCADEDFTIVYEEIDVLGGEQVDEELTELFRKQLDLGTDE